MSILIFHISILSVSAEVDTAGDGSSGDSSSCSVEVGCNYTDSSWYYDGANCLDVFTATFSTSTSHDVAACVFMTSDTSACNSFQVMGNVGVGFNYVNTRSYSGHSVAERNETLTVAEEQGVLTQQTSIFNACYYNLTAEDNNPNSWVTGIPLFKTRDACIEYLNTGVINEDELVSFDTFDNESEEVLLSEDELVPPTNLEFKHNDILECLRRTSSIFADLPRLDASWNNENIISDTNIELKTELQVKGEYYYSDTDEVLCNQSSDPGSKQLNANPSVYGVSGWTKVSTDWYTLSNDSLFLNYQFNIFDSSFLSLTVPELVSSDYITYLSKNNMILSFYNIDPLRSMGSLNMFDVNESYRVRYYYILDGKKYVSNWVEFGADYSGDKSKKDEYTTVTDNDGNDTDSSYYDDNGNSTTGTDPAVKDTTSFWDWLNKQINGISNVFSSIVNLFNQAKNAGTSFVDLFTAYNKWIPSSIMSLLTIGIGIMVFLRIVGR